MAQPPSARNHAPSAWHVFQRDLSNIGSWFRREFEPFMDWLMAFTLRGAQRRAFLFIIFTIVLWLGLALLAQPVRWGFGPLPLQFFTALFAVDVLRHLLVLGLALWLGLRMSAIYLDDVFELKDVSVAERFIRRAAFAGQYDRVTIKDGGIPPENRNSPVLRIGGPGWVDVHLENVAIFERVDGSPHIISPTQKYLAVLQGFERMRRVIDLRDQVIELTVESRTQDGIPVVAKDVKMVFSVYRGEHAHLEDEAFPQPYPFEPQAVHVLVYKQGRGNWITAMQSLIRRELRQFISQHTLSEFLTNARVESTHPFVPREQLTDLFYDFAYGFSRRAVELGVQLNWIGVGTWVTPSEIIPERHLEAWKLSGQTRVLKNEHVLHLLRNESRLSELIHLVDEILTTYYEQLSQDADPEQTMRQLLLTYREKLHNALDLYQGHNQPAPPELEAAIQHLTVLSAHWLGDHP